MANHADLVVHVAMMPSAGMGHLLPCLRVASMFLRCNCRLTLITPKPTVSLAESDMISRFCNAFPQVKQIDLPLLPLDPTTVNSTDPFWLQFEAIRRSAHLVSPILASLSPPLSAFIHDVSLVSPLLPVCESLSLPSYIYFISPARMFSFFAHLSVLSASHPCNAHPANFIGDAVEIPGLTPIPRSSIPPLLLEPNSLFEKIFMEDSPKLRKLHGIFVNTFEKVEPDAIAALNDGRVVAGLPPVHAVGPLMPCKFEKEIQVRSTCSPYLKWLDDQPAGSVVYVCFGNRTETKGEQIKEMADGLMKSGYRFLWVVKLKKVDREEDEELEEVFGHELMEKTKVKGLVVKTWVDQNEILGHPAVGGFVNHGGWNSLIEAIWHGVPILSWSQNGDQKINSEALQLSGAGIWPEEWGWGWEKVVKGENFAKAIKEMMSNESLKVRVSELKEEARKAASAGGSAEQIVKRLIDEWGKKIVQSI